MESLQGLVKHTLPNYLKNLPIPDSFVGFISLSAREWLHLVPFFGTISMLAYISYHAFASQITTADSVVNPSVQKGKAKVADVFEIEDLSDKVSFCRCWRSNKFPLCDGTHMAHNEATGDNVGPVVLKRKDAGK